MKIPGCSWASAPFANACTIFSNCKEYDFLRDGEHRQKFFGFIVKLERRDDDVNALSVLTAISKSLSSLLPDQMNLLQDLLDRYKHKEGL